MADWRDGPEYAPQERPDAFTPAGAPELAEAAPAAPAPDAPADQPEFTASGADIPLHALAAPGGDQRDPHASFNVVSTPLATLPDVPTPAQPTQPMALTTQPSGSAPWTPPASPPPLAPLQQASAWGAAHAPQAPPRTHDVRAPQQPMALPDLPPVNPPGGPPGHPGQGPQVNPQNFPTRQDASWYAPYDGPAHPQRTDPVTARDLVNAADPVVLAVLAAGGLLPFFGLSWLAPPLLFLAAVLATQRVRYRTRAVRTTFWVACGSSVLMSALVFSASYSPYIWEFWAPLSGLSQFSCWVVTGVLLLVVSGALRRGERPSL